MFDFAQTVFGRPFFHERKDAVGNGEQGGIGLFPGRKCRPGKRYIRGKPGADQICKCFIILFPERRIPGKFFPVDAHEVIDPQKKVLRCCHPGTGIGFRRPFFIGFTGIGCVILFDIGIKEAR